MASLLDSNHEPLLRRVMPECVFCSVLAHVIGEIVGADNGILENPLDSTVIGNG
jgi:hypothetical protein